MDSKLLKTIRRLWEPPEPEIPSPPKPEFQPGKTCYDIPPPEKYDLYDLDPLSKRKMTICNLFVNHGERFPRWECAPFTEKDKAELKEAIQKTGVSLD